MYEFQDSSSGKVLSSVLAQMRKGDKNPKSTTDLESGNPNQTFETYVSMGAWIKAGNPVKLGDFDQTGDTILFAYDPTITPDPEFALLDGDKTGHKILTMNGKHMVQISNAPSLCLSDIQVVETALAI